MMVRAKTKYALILFGGPLAAAIFLLSPGFDMRKSESTAWINSNNTPVSTGPEIGEDCSTLPVRDIEEADQPENSTDLCWWLNSGGKLLFSDGLVSTLAGRLNSSDSWRIEYAITNPTDTQSGYYPQNLLRLVSRKDWKNPILQGYFRVLAYNLTNSPNRNESNGVFFMLHYLNGDNLYYGGLRVDGMAVIKKKVHGAYETLAQTYYETGTAYDKNHEPNLLPVNSWIGLRFSASDNPDGSVTLKLFADLKGDENWVPILSVRDNAGLSGAAPFRSPGRVGIRTDFMDAEFKNFSIED